MGDGQSDEASEKRAPTDGLGAHEPVGRPTAVGVGQAVGGTRTLDTVGPDTGGLRDALAGRAVGTRLSAFASRPIQTPDAAGTVSG
jgi:hypothetical protein